jgi:hypothetical protein
MHRVGLLLMCAMLCLPASGHAQTLTADAPPSSASNPCPPRDVPVASNALTRSLVSEWAMLAQNWCKLSRWDRPWPAAQDFLVNLLTGPGLHPTAGIVVPEGGLAAGLELNIPWNEKMAPFGRSAMNFEGRGSEHGFWEIGAQLQTMFPGYTSGGTSPQFTLSAKHWDMPQLPFYGLGNNTSRDGRVLFGLKETAVVPGFDTPLPFGFTLSGELAVLWFQPDPSATFDNVHSEATAPGLHADTTYLRPHILATWRYPINDVLYGLSTSAAAAYELDEALSGGRYSFTRFDARWNLALGLGPDFGTFRVSTRLTLGAPLARNSVPFYLQPTLGGADINDQNMLRGYNDYRFRARNLIAYEVSYERQIVDPLGFRIFAELGKVGVQPGELGFKGIKSSVGVSATFRLGGATVAEISLAWGGGEGAHVYATGNTNNVGGVSAGLRGVF